MENIENNTQRLLSNVQLLKLTAQNHMQNINSINRNFRNQLTEESSKLTKSHLFSKVNILAQSYETILLVDIAVSLENVGVAQLSQLYFTVFYQMININKWVINNYLHERTIDDRNQAQENYRKMQSNVAAHGSKGYMNVNQFYKAKETCQFFAHSIQDQLTKMKDEFHQEKQQYEMSNFIKNRQKLQNIKPTQRQFLLVEAIQHMSNQSEMFKLYINSANQKLFQDYKNMNVIPYPKLRDEIDKHSNNKLKTASTDLSAIIKKFLHKIQSAQQEKQSFQEMQTQTDKIDDVEKIQKVKKNHKQEIQKLNLKIKQSEDYVKKLELMIKEKSNYFEKQLMKVKVACKDNVDLQTLKKSVRNVRSNQNLTHSQIREQSDVNLETNIKRKRALKKPTIQKRIRFGSQMPRDIQMDTSLAHDCMAAQKYHIKLTEPLKPKIYTFQSRVFDFFIGSQFQPKIQERSKKQVTRLISLQSGVIKYYTPEISYQQKKKRKQSLITIKGCNLTSFKQTHRPSKKNIRKMSHEVNDGQILQKQIMNEFFPSKMKSQEKLAEIIQSSTGKAFRKTNYDPDYSRRKNILTETPNSNLNQNSQRHLSKQVTSRSSKSIVFAQEQKPIKILKKQRKSRNVQNIFELINLDTNQLKKRQLNIKALRNYSKGMENFYAQNRLSHKDQRIDLDKNDVTALFQSEENAMEAQISFGIGFSSICQRLLTDNNDFYNQLEQFILKFRPNDVIRLKKFLRYPHSTVYSKKSLTIQNLTSEKFKQIVHYISNLHSKCVKDDKFCSHIANFLKKISVRKIY